MTASPDFGQKCLFRHLFIQSSCLHEEARSKRKRVPEKTGTENGRAISAIARMAHLFFKIFIFKID